MNRVKGAQEYLKKKGFNLQDSENVYEAEQVYYVGLFRVQWTAIRSEHRSG